MPARSRRIPSPPALATTLASSVKGSLSVLARLHHVRRREWLRIGIAELLHEPSGEVHVRIHLGAVPDDRYLYIPLRDLLVLLSETSTASDAYSHSTAPDLPRQ